MKTLSSRRNFIKMSALLSAAAVATRNLSAAAKSAQPLGIQLYTVQGALMADPLGTLKKLYEIGYREVETAGSGKITAQQFRTWIDDSGLKCPSAHVDLTGELGPAFETVHALGAHYATSSIFIPNTLIDPATNKRKGFNDLTSDDFKRIAENANRVGKAAHAAGLQYCYHNHNFEFRDLGDGHFGYQILLQETDPSLVDFEIDCGWVVTAGHDPIEIMQHHKGRVKMIHVKDFQVGTSVVTKLGTDLTKGAELGRGHIDYRPIFAAARKAGVTHFFSEQEGPFLQHTPLEAAQINFDYMRQLL